jgi:hypothetical protein
MKRSAVTALASWRALNEIIGELSETEVAQLLVVERANKRRPNVVKRLHQRLTRLRMKRERAELRRNP